MRLGGGMWRNGRRFGSTLLRQLGVSLAVLVRR